MFVKIASLHTCRSFIDSGTFAILRASSEFRLFIHPLFLILYSVLHFLKAFLLLCSNTSISSRHHDQDSTGAWLLSTCAIIITDRFVLNSLGPRYTKPGLQVEKKTELTINSKKIIAMTGSLVILYPTWRQSVIAIYFLYLWWAGFFPPAVRALYILGRNVDAIVTFTWLSSITLLLY